MISSWPGDRHFCPRASPGNSPEGSLGGPDDPQGTSKSTKGPPKGTPTEPRGPPRTPQDAPRRHPRGGYGAHREPGTPSEPRTVHFGAILGRCWVDFSYLLSCCWWDFEDLRGAASHMITTLLDIGYQRVSIYVVACWYRFGIVLCLCFTHFQLLFNRSAHSAGPIRS